MFSRSCVLPVLFTIALALIAPLFQSFYRGNDKPELLLGVCVMSARDNVEQRAAIRKTWLTSVTDINTDSGIGGTTNRTVLRFVVGQEACIVHPLDRVDQYACKPWTPDLSPDLRKDFEAFIEEDVTTMGPKVNQLRIKVQHPVVVKRLGILSDIPLSDHAMVVSAFLDLEEEELRSAQFSVKDPGIEHRGYRYQAVEPVVLQKGTQLELSMRSKGDDSKGTSPDSYVISQHKVRQLHGPRVLLVQGMRDDGTIIKDDNSSLLSTVSFMYSVHDADSLLLHDQGRQQRHGDWREKMRAEAEALEAEVTQHGDILLVEGVDTYRSLPAKVLHCHHWLSQTYSTQHVLKTDDDCYVDLPAITRHLSQRPLSRTQVWANFRQEWGVPRVGKWGEEDYAPSLYPPFPCGSGYVVSRDLHQWLASNHPVLHPFQGEDVSMGIWLSPLAPTLVQDWRWQCYKLCQDSMLSLPDLTPVQLLTLWNNSQRCGSPCSSC